MKYSDEENERLFLEQDKYMDARAEELLNHDPELVEFYHRGKKWKLGVKALQGQLIELIESEQIAIQLQNHIGSYKNVSDRIKEVPPDAFVREGIASDCADAMDAAAEYLRGCLKSS